MAAIVEESSENRTHAERYYVSGYPSTDAFRAELEGRGLRMFEPQAAPEDIGNPQKVRRTGKRGLLRWGLESYGQRAIDYFEFGVMSCATFNRVIEWSPNSETKFFGFDTFEGLPEPWIRERKDGSLLLGRDAGELKAATPPAVYDERATLFKGMFQDTLPDALALAFPNGRDRDRPMFLNIDSDLYSSALYVLTSMHPLIRSGDLVYFDEFFDALNEFAAFNDYIRAYNTRAWFAPMARAFDGMLFRIDIPESQAAAEMIDRRSTHFLERMKAYVRARASLLKPNDPGR